MSNCSICEQELVEKLSSIPSKWREQLAKILCEIREGKSLDCEKVKECETLTVLSPFEVVGTQVSVKYKDEKEVEYTRTFDFSQIINNSLNNIDPKCLTTQSEWDNMTFSERIQTIINGHSDCFCVTTTTTSSTTTTTSSSTTTTTTSA